MPTVLYTWHAAIWPLGYVTMCVYPPPEMVLEVKQGKKLKLDILEGYLEHVAAGLLLGKTPSVY